MRKIGAAFIAACLLSLPALAGAESPALDMTKALVKTDGSAIKDDLSPRAENETKADPRCDKCEDLTLGKAVATALRYSTMADQEISRDAVQKAIRAHLADSIERAPAARLSNRDVETIKKALNSTPLAGVTIAAILPIIDPNGWAKAIEQDAAK